MTTIQHTMSEGSILLGKNAALYTAARKGFEPFGS